MLARWNAFAGRPVEDVGVLLGEQPLIDIEFRLGEARHMLRCKRAEQDVGLLHAGVAGAVDQPLATLVDGLAHARRLRKNGGDNNAGGRPYEAGRRDMRPAQNAAMRPPILFPLFAPVTTIPGIGLRFAKLLEKIGLAKVGDFLWHLPTGLIDRRATPKVAEAPAGEVVTLVVRVEKHLPPPNPRVPYKVRC